MKVVIVIYISRYQKKNASRQNTFGKRKIKISTEML